MILNRLKDKNGWEKGQRKSKVAGRMDDEKTVVMI